MDKALIILLKFIPSLLFVATAAMASYSDRYFAGAALLGVAALFTLRWMEDAEEEIDAQQ